MADYVCRNCLLRKKYDKNPGSILGRIWRWHAGWCPGWNRYMGTLSNRERQIMAEKYNLKR